MNYLISTGLLVITFLFPAYSSVQKYEGSSFNEVWSMITNPIPTLKMKEDKLEFNVYERGDLPQYPVNASSIFSKDKTALERDAKRTVNERFDYYDRIAKKVHANGVCVAGYWKITSPSPYSGALAAGFEGLFIGRLSVAMEKTNVGSDRGFGFAGKIFPTLNPTLIVKTGNFFTVDVLLGTKLSHILEAKTTNKPDTGFNLSLIGLGLRIASALSKGDNDPGFRPLTQIAELGEMDSVLPKQPKFLRLSPEAAILTNDEKDFRNEVLRTMNENGFIKYAVDVSNGTSDRNAVQGWQRLGTINLTKAIASYGCDRQLHFAHPKLK